MSPDNASLPMATVLRRNALSRGEAQERGSVPTRSQPVPKGHVTRIHTGPPAATARRLKRLPRASVLRPAKAVPKSAEGEIEDRPTGP